MVMPGRVLVSDSCTIHFHTSLTIVAPLLVRLAVEMTIRGEASALAESLSKSSIFTMPLREGLAHHLLLDLVAPSLIPHPSGVLSSVGLSGVSVACREWIIILLPRAEVVGDEGHIMDCCRLGLELWVVLHQAPNHVRAVPPPLVHLLASCAPTYMNLGSRLVPVVASSHQGISLGEGL